jgi:hypothetical protein
VIRGSTDAYSTEHEGVGRLLAEHEGVRRRLAEHEGVRRCGEDQVSGSSSLAKAAVRDA